MPTWCKEEEARLLRRTEDLREMTRALILNTGPHSPEAHNDLRRQVEQHHRELMVYGERCRKLGY